jgi:hypothetical protein
MMAELFLIPYASLNNNLHISSLVAINKVIFFNLFADYGALIIIALCLYILFFASGLGATPWAINSEVLLFYCILDVK